MTFRQFLLQDNAKLLKQIFEAQAKGAKSYIKILLKQLNENNKTLHIMEKCI
jgi:hypothetical protein